MYIYVYICIYMYICKKYICINIYTYIYIYINEYMFFMCAYICIYVYMYIYIYVSIGFYSPNNEVLGFSICAKKGIV